MAEKIKALAENHVVQSIIAWVVVLAMVAILVIILWPVVSPFVAKFVEYCDYRKPIAELSAYCLARR